MANDSGGRRAGRKADGRASPFGISAGGWKRVLLRVKDEIRNDQVGLLAAGVSFYAMLALFPAIVAAVLVYGLVAEPALVREQIASFASALPGSARELVTDNLQQVAAADQRGLGVGLVASLLGVLWSASSGVKGLIGAINRAYDEKETRPFLRLRGLAILLTLAGIIGFVVGVGLIAVVPVVVSNLDVDASAQTVSSLVRWPLLAVGMIGALTVIYRLAPDRDEPSWRWTSVGSVVATVLWLLGSGVFSLYVSNFGSYEATYGSLGAVVVLLLWFFLSAFVVLLGAEINAEIEREAGVRSAPP